MNNASTSTSLDLKGSDFHRSIRRVIRLHLQLKLAGKYLTEDSLTELIALEFGMNADEMMYDDHTNQVVSALVKSVRNYQIPFDHGFGKYPVQVGVNLTPWETSDAYMGFDLIGFDKSLGMGGMTHFQIDDQEEFLVCIMSSLSLQEEVLIFNEFLTPEYDKLFAVHVNHFSTTTLEMTEQTRIYSFRDGFLDDVNDVVKIRKLSIA
jgi:hypothetical protein